MLIFNRGLFAKDLTDNNSFPQAVLNPTDKTTYLKLSPDFLTARNDWNIVWQSVRSVSLILDQCYYYYEVQIHTSGPMRVGWATKSTELSGSNSPIGSDKFSIAYDGFHQCVWHKNGQVPAVPLDREYSVKDLQKSPWKFKYISSSQAQESCSWKAGDVVGCLLYSNGNQSGFYFFLNGQLIHHRAEVYTSPHPYYAAVSLAQHQQCCFNFGQQPFQYEPLDIAQIDTETEKLSQHIETQINLGDANHTVLSLATGKDSQNKTTIGGDLMFQSNKSEIKNQEIPSIVDAAIKGKFKFM